MILIYDRNREKILMCKRSKEPFKGLLQLVGGKIENGEDGLSAAYREMLEETSIPFNVIRLSHLMDFTYYYSDCYVEVYVGKLKNDVVVNGDENELFWIDADKDFFDKNTFAGDGNIGHIIEETKYYLDKLFE